MYLVRSEIKQLKEDLMPSNISFRSNAAISKSIIGLDRISALVIKKVNKNINDEVSFNFEEKIRKTREI